MDQNQKRVADTWAELGFKLRPLRKLVFVRTELRPEREGLIWLLPSERTNYAGLGHTVFMRAVVVGTGPDCKILKVGDRVAFTRLFFAWLFKLQDGTLVGYIDADNIAAEDLIEYPQESE